MGSTNPSYSTAIFYESNKYYMFDPHSRNEAGMPTPDGCAALTLQKDIQFVSLFIRYHFSQNFQPSESPEMCLSLSKFCHQIWRFTEEEKLIEMRR